MTLWFCDRCGRQVKKDSYGAGKYSIQKTFFEKDPDNPNGPMEKVQRFLKFCDECSVEMENFLDDEFRQVPAAVSGVVDKRH